MLEEGDPMNKLTKKCIALLLVCAMILCLGACAMAENESGKTQMVYAKVVEIEKYGHAVLDITTSEFIESGYALGDIVCVRVGSYEADMPFFDGYYTDAGDVLLRGLTPEANIAVCINYGDFSKENAVTIGDAVELTLTEKAGMLSVQELSSLQYSDNRADYSSDAVFANFRAVTAGRIGQHKLFRTASPIDNARGRASCADDLIASAGIATVLNLSDSDEEIAAFCEAEDFDSAYYYTLYESGKVVAVALLANFFTEDYAASIAEGFTFLAKNDPPYGIHCLEGKDRTGFALMLLEALMGAELDEIIDDYMVSFANYYGINKETEPERYQTVLDKNLIPMLCHMAGVKTSEELAQIDLETAATDYLLRAGMTEEEILTLQEKLG